MALGMLLFLSLALWPLILLEFGSTSANSDDLLAHGISKRSFVISIATFNYLTEHASAVFCLRTYWEAKPLKLDFKRHTIFHLCQYFLLNSFNY